MKFLSALDVNLKDFNELQANYSTFSLVLKYSGRWIITLAALRENTELDIIDMLDEELNSDQRNEFLDVVKKIVGSKLPGLNFTNYNWIDKYAVEWFCDCGVFACVYLYNFWKRGTLINFKANFPHQKENFKDALTWLILKNTCLLF